jgi:SAM-dependent methyltransferase
MSAFSQELIGRSGYLNEGFADVYDHYRPSPPSEVLDILTVVAGVERPGLVVDLGCGTGLATRAWAERADEVIGVEPNPRMLERARARGRRGVLGSPEGPARSAGAVGNPSRGCELAKGPASRRDPRERTLSLHA